MYVIRGESANIRYAACKTGTPYRHFFAPVRRYRSEGPFISRRATHGISREGWFQFETSLSCYSLLTRSMFESLRLVRLIASPSFAEVMELSANM